MYFLLGPNFDHDSIIQKCQQAYDITFKAHETYTKSQALNQDNDHLDIYKYPFPNHQPNQDY